MLATITIIVTNSISLFGLLATYAIIWFGVPRALRLQEAKQSMEAFHRQLPLILFNIALLSLMTFISLRMFDSHFSMETPRWWVIALDVAFVFVIDDIWFYMWHRAMHEVKFVYRHVHRIHHRAYAPLPMHLLYVHPIEWMVGVIGPGLGFALLFLFHDQVSAYTIWVAGGLRQLHELNIHSGIRSFLLRYIPFLGLTDTHDYHHRYPTKGNYSSTFRIWDRVFGTATAE